MDEGFYVYCHHCDKQHRCHFRPCPVCMVRDIIMPKAPKACRYRFWMCDGCKVKARPKKRGRPPKKREES